MSFTFPHRSRLAGQQAVPDGPDRGDGADFGQAVRQDIAAQVASPDARYAGVIAPGSNAARVAAAQDRYARGKVIQPSNQVAAASVTSASGASAGLTQ